MNGMSGRLYVETSIVYGRTVYHVLYGNVGVQTFSRRSAADKFVSDIKGSVRTNGLQFPSA